MREAIDALFELETRRVDDAHEALRTAQTAFDEAEAALARAEQHVLAHDEARKQERARRPVDAQVSPTELARDDAFRKAMRVERVELVERVERAVHEREARASSLEAARLALAESRARARAIEARIEARDAARKRAAEQRAEDDAEEHRRR